MQASVPPAIQPVFDNSGGEDDDSDADGEPSYSDEDSYSSEDSEGWVPKKTSEQAGSSVAAKSAGRPQLAPARPAAAKTTAPKPAGSKFAFKSGFLTGILLLSCDRGHAACDSEPCVTLGSCRTSLACTCRRKNKWRYNEQGQRRA